MTHPPLRAPHSCTYPLHPAQPCSMARCAGPPCRGRGLLTPHRALACPSQFWVPERGIKGQRRAERMPDPASGEGPSAHDQAPASGRLHPASGGLPYRGVLSTVVANEAAAPGVPLCPAADVVDATLDDQPLVARQVVLADLLPAEGGQRRPRRRGPLAGLPDAAHGCVRMPSGPRYLGDVCQRPRGERVAVPGASSAATGSSAAPPCRCGRRTSVRLPGSRRRELFPPL